MDKAALDHFMDERFAQARGFGFAIDHVRADGVQVSLPITQQHLRPGNTVSGPTLMTLADTGMYLVLLSRIGPQALAVTTNLNINFLRRPSCELILAQCSLLKLGRRLAVGEVIMSDADQPDEPLAHATLTYSLPPA